MVQELSDGCSVDPACYTEQMKRPTLWHWPSPGPLVPTVLTALPATATPVKDSVSWRADGPSVSGIRADSRD